MPTVISGATVLSMVRGEEAFQGSIVVGDDGGLEAVGVDVHLPETYESIDATGCLVMPGLIDAHRHLWMSSIRGFTADMTTAEYMKTVRLGAMSEFRAEDIRAGVLVGALDGLNSGTTTMMDFAHCLNSEDHVAANLEAILESGARVVFALGLNNVPGIKDGFASFKERAKSAEKVAQTGTGSDLVPLWLSSSSVFDGEENFRDEFRLARDMGLPMTLHARTLNYEGCPSEVSLLEEAGLLSPSILWSHMPRATEREMKTVFDSGGTYVSIPGTELRGELGFPNIGKWRDLGGRPSIGISNSSGGVANLFDTMRISLLVQRQMEREAASNAIEGTDQHVSIPMREAVEWVTINAAEALGVADQVGSLSPGKDADLIIIKPNLFIRPVLNPWATVVMNVDSSHVDTVMVKGNVVKRDGRLTMNLDKATDEFLASGRYLGSKIPGLKPIDQR